MRILVTGSRNWANEELIHRLLAQYAEQVLMTELAPQFVVVHGDYPGGADRAADDWANERRRANLFSKGADWIRSEPHRADWDRYGKAAGPIRNQAMVFAGADVCLAFPLGESRGTRDCMARAEAAGMPVLNYGES